MSWDRVIRPAERDGVPLRAQVEALLAEQREDWPLFRDGEGALRDVRARILVCDGARVIVQANPGRKVSVHARVDPRSVAARPCFLCPDNMPPEERGVAFGDLVLCPNPYPIVRRHLTVPAREHSPQRLRGRVDDMLALAQAVGPESFVVYNGPKCGASAPDHFHFQTGRSAGVPILEEHGVDGPEVAAVSSFGRRLVVVRGEQPDRVRELLERGLARLPPVDGEPPVNVAAVFRDGRYTLFLIPRPKHRPECYFADEPRRIALSPATLEMMGVLVVADEGHFDRVDSEVALRVFEEVCLGDDEIRELAEGMQCA